MGIWNPPPTAVPTAHHTTHEQGGSDLIANAAWTNASNIFTNPEQRINGATYARLNIKDLSQPADQRQFDVLVQNQKLALRPTNDGDAATATGLVLDRSANVQVGGNLAIGGAALGTTNVARIDVANTFTASDQYFQATGDTRLWLKDLSQPVDTRAWDIINNSQNLAFRAMTDAAGLVANTLILSRAGDALVGRDLYEKARTTPMGHWINVPFNAANFAAVSPMTWTVASGNIVNNRYAVVGKTVFWNLWIQGTTLGGSPSTVIFIAPPTGGLSINQPNMGQIINAGVGSAGTTVYYSGNMAVQRVDSANFTLGSLDIRILMIYELP